MGAVADKYCHYAILTNEDPCDEDPRSIVDGLARGMKRTPDIVMDRREAIAKAVAMAQPGDAVLITGKGTDPTIYGPAGSKVPWSDSAVAREELEKLLKPKV
jgi:UDP-N-acetylmuramoyl-L-alanyl-D-glutamate--2,6-diaminopimelate ligase